MGWLLWPSAVATGVLPLAPSDTRATAASPLAAVVLHSGGYCSVNVAAFKARGYRGLMRRIVCVTFAAVWLQFPTFAQESADEPLVLSDIYARGDRSVEDPGLLLIVGENALQQSARDHPAEAINVLPGVNIQMNSGQEHLIALRSPVLTGGAGQGSFLILENGLPTRSSAFGNVNGLFEPLHELASDIEVVVGPGSAKFGSNAVHGLMNFNLPDPSDASSWIDVSVSSLERQSLRGLLRVMDSTLAGVSLQNDTGWRSNTSVGQQKLYLAHAFELGGWDGLAWISATNLNQETADFIQGPKAYRDRDIAKGNDDPDAFRDAQSARLAVQLVREVKGVDVRLTPYARWQEMEFRQHFLPYRGFEENGHSAFGLQTRADWVFSKNVTFRAGFDTDFASGNLIETQPEPFGFFPGDTRFPQGVHYDYDVDTEVYALWAELDWQASDRLKVLAGLREEVQLYDYRTNIAAGINGSFNVAENRSDDFELFTPKIGVVYDLTDLNSFFANFARGQRAPQASDLYRLQSQQLPGEARVETLDSFEAGFRGVLMNEMLTYQIAAYTADKDNFFFRDADGLNVSDGTTRHQGIDAVWRLNWLEVFAIAGSASWSDQTYTFDRAANGIVDGNQIDTAPEWLADLAFIWAPEARFSWRVEVEYVGEYFTNPANTREYPGHVVFHAGASYEMADDKEIYARVRNLFDLKYADRADFAFGNDRFFPGEPLNITIGFRKTFKP